MHVRLGTSGFSYAPWKGPFYPAKLPNKQMLAFYAGKLGTVEINNTFYRMPKPELLAGWAAETPPDFRFVLKAPQRITHQKRLLDVQGELEYFDRAAAVLEQRLGPVLMQLPPFFRKDIPRLRDFLALAKTHAPHLRLACEFRHDSWWDPETFSTLRDGGAVLCWAEAAALTTPFEFTAAWGYLRLRREDYDDAMLATWAERIAAQTTRWNEVFVFFKHEDAGIGPQLAQRLAQRLRDLSPAISVS